MMKYFIFLAISLLLILSGAVVVLFEIQDSRINNVVQENNNTLRREIRFFISNTIKHYQNDAIYAGGIGSCGITNGILCGNIQIDYEVNTEVGIRVEQDREIILDDFNFVFYNRSDQGTEAEIVKVNCSINVRNHPNLPDKSVVEFIISIGTLDSSPNKCQETDKP